MAKTRVLAKVGIKANSDELVYYKNGVLYAVKRKVGGTKGAHRCAAKKKAVKKAAPAKLAKKSVAKKRAVTKKVATKKAKK